RHPAGSIQKHLFDLFACFHREATSRCETTLSDRALSNHTKALVSGTEGTTGNWITWTRAIPPKHAAGAWPLYTGCAIKR
ncbi:hypothetical protein V5799_007019, partial [Amblyomma americanum]